MNKAKIVFGIVAVIFAITALYISYKSDDTPYEKERNIIPKEVSNETITDTEERFFLIAEDNYLNLYNSDKNGSLRKSEQINFNLFPNKDVEELRKGKVFYSETEAYETMESFIN